MTRATRKSKDTVKRVPSVPAEGGAKPQFYSLFYKTGAVPLDAGNSSGSEVEKSRAIPPVLSQASESRGRETDSVYIEEVSSPPQEPSEPQPLDPKDTASTRRNPSRLRSIFDLPVPEPALSRVSSTNSLASLKKRKERGPNKDHPPAKKRPSAPQTPSAILLDDDESEKSVVEIQEIELLEENSSEDKDLGTTKHETLATATALSIPSKPLHPFFASKRPDKNAGLTADAPLIVVDDPPQNSAPSTIGPLPRRKTKERTVSSNFRPTFKRKHLPPVPPLPSELAQHVRGPQSSFLLEPRFHSVLVGAKSSGQKESASRTGGFSLSDVFPVLPVPPHAREAPILPFSDLERCSDLLSSIPADHLERPALARFCDRAGTGFDVNSDEMWAHSCRPRRADEVLGNEQDAGYLKAWLQALELAPPCVTVASQPAGDSKVITKLGDAKRQTVVRVAEKRAQRGKKRQKVSHDGYGSDDWIVSDATSSEPEGDYSDWHSSQCEEHVSGPFRNASPFTYHNLQAAPHLPIPEAFSPLTNTILIHGPPGSGKTAAVYACAEELGWEVHEIYPGMLKRSAANIAAIVEGVSKNHVLGSSGQNTSSNDQEPQKSRHGEINSPLNGTLSVPGVVRRNISGSQDEPILLDTSEHLPSNNAAPLQGTANGATSDAESTQGKSFSNLRPRQSLILIEEVDILYGNDHNFWQGVIALIAESRRPVILTCNDLFHIPQDQLPLQATLTFQSPDRQLLTSYLRVLGMAQGQILSQEDGERLVAEAVYRLIPQDVPNHPVHPLPFHPPPTIDLRRALNRLQFLSRASAREPFDVADLQALRALYIDNWVELEESLCDWNNSHNINQTAPADSDREKAVQLDSLWRFMDTISVVDSHVNRRPGSNLEALSIDRYEPSLDDEVGYTLLCKPPQTDISPGLDFYRRDEEIALETMVQARKCLNKPTAGFPGVDEHHGTGNSTQEMGLAEEDLAGATNEPKEIPGLNSLMTFDSQRLFKDRADYQAKIVGYLDEVITLHCPLLPRPATILDYVGMISRMVEIDDALELCVGQLQQQDGEGGGNVGRSTRPIRQSSRVARQPRAFTHERWITLTEGGVHAARASKLRWT